LNSNATPFRYDDRTVRLHWLTVALVVTLWLLGQTIDEFPKGMPRVGARSLHILLGATLAFVLSYRIWWRSTSGARLPAAEKDKLQPIVSLYHLALYAVMVATVLAGLSNAWVRGDNILGLFRIPEFDPGNKDLRQTVEDLHAVLANTLFIGAALHAVFGFVHHFVMKDNVLRRMRRLR